MGALEGGWVCGVHGTHSCRGWGLGELGSDSESQPVVQSVMKLDWMDLSEAVVTVLLSTSRVALGTPLSYSKPQLLHLKNVCEHPMS